ncbi:melanoma-associated antigen B18-like [Acomys russatus]|uniref:melanoma-associated antigen B18-like n=1 Tax=Acomys russatus TaxID=60746 RepID=UPI0021E303B5|nr:melanoma-associated antigen B18-like [Acomys russatus]
MPRGHKSKLRARERRHQARSETWSMQHAQDSAAEERETLSSSSHRCSANVQSKDEERRSTSLALSSTRYSPSTERDDVAISLVHFMLRKYHRREPITKEDMLEHVFPQNKEQFPVALKKASELMVIAFGIDVKEVDPIRHCYAFFRILSPNGNDEIMNGEAIMPKNGLLITILCVIFMNGSCANEECIWDILSVMGIYAGVNHFMYGNVKKLITKDFVNEGYLEYRQVPIRGSPCRQFLWGPRALYETSKMRVLEFLAKVYNTVPTAFPSLYEEALRAEQERTQGRFVSMVLVGLMGSSPSSGDSSNSFNFF